ncbi:hypothetical protein AGLY_016547 [Aphis glycines]|uniref:Uncharacterized protein n=1 Tax=Aphis glycines TaxID=307491 RepID=A0A6G0SYM0_APHGL|nr:hypothetical protein AGLY_016547 [Aphis glycines]
MKTVEKCSLLTVSSIKDIRFAVENPPQNLPFSVIFFFVYLNYYENCWEMFTYNGYTHQGHSICSRKPPSKFVIGAFFRQVIILFKYRFGRIPVLCMICRFRCFFFSFMSIIMKTVEKCSLLTVSSIKDIRFAVENPPQSLFAVYLNYHENCWEMFTFNGYTHQGHSICSRKPPSKFAVFGHFFFVYLNYFENCWEMFTFNGYKHQGHSICSRKPPSKFVIGAFFRLVMLYKETKKKNSEIYKKLKKIHTFLKIQQYIDNRYINIL